MKKAKPDNELAKYPKAFIDDCTCSANAESDLVKESVAKSGKPDLEAEIEFRKFWGLL